ncbi:MAG TPA: NAD(P)/FAD-dependent oxidoreductase [Casimicrobiaceae bacterium]|nr:NAD(P)/FAD-dependent oxidoreductase [Casimicrobiaceae bacterium]
MGALRTAVVIGAGPAGLTAALELIRRTDVRPLVIEASDTVGGISRTVNVNGYRMDIGGHRFFSKSDWVMDWWLDILPLEAGADRSAVISYRNRHRALDASRVAANDGDGVMLLRRRLSRIYFLRRFFDYPLKLDPATIAKLGPARFARICASYAWSTCFPRRPEKSLEDFLVNRFGGELYRTFFKSYTEKVWGVPCAEISAEFGAQRIKGLSLTRAVLHSLRKMASAPAGPAAQTSLVERFLYPKYGPGQLWEEVAQRVRRGGGELRLQHAAEKLRVVDGRVIEVAVRDLSRGKRYAVAPDFVISSMAVKDLVSGLDPAPPEDVRSIASRLPYRAFIAVGVLARRMQVRGHGAADTPFPPDNWIYVQEPDVRLGRLQIFNNWSPALAPDPSKVWLGLEYFCAEDDELWRLPDAELAALAVRELEQIELIDSADVLDTTVVRVPKAYPAYFGSYAEFDRVRAHLDPIDNLFLVGRNGMHRYNNQDHSMLTAKAAVDCIAEERSDKQAIWSVNVDDDYHESR